METRYGIRITSYRGGVPGAIHFYGEAWRYDGDTVEREDLTRELGIGAARRLNRHDWGELVAGFRWKPGMKTNRFDSEDDVITAGASYLTDHYGASIEIERGDPWGLENPVLNQCKG